MALGMCVAPVGGELIEAHGLLVVLGQPAPAVRVHQSEGGLPRRIALVGSEFIEAHSFGVLLGQPATGE
jgi:hypothetical protein